jgi:hypothetical protein
MESTSNMKKTWLKNIKELKFCNKNPETLVTLCIINSLFNELIFETKHENI